MDTRHLGQAWGFSFGFHTFIACHVTRLPLTTYHLPVTTCHLPLSLLSTLRQSHQPARGRVRGYILSLCHFALDDTFFNLRAQWETFATMGYQMTTCHEADTTFSRRNGQRMPGCLTAWLYSISIGACFKSIFIIIFISFFFLVFLFFLFFPPLGSFAFVVGVGSVRSFGIIVAPCGQFVVCFCGSM